MIIIFLVVCVILVGSRLISGAKPTQEIINLLTLSTEKQPILYKKTPSIYINFSIDNFFPQKKRREKSKNKLTFL